MRHFCLLFCFLTFFVLTFVSWWIVLWDPAFIAELANALPRLYMMEWGRAFIFTFGAAGFVCTLFLFGELLGVKADPRRHIVFDGKPESARLTLDAVEDFIRMKGMAVPEVREIDARVEVYRKTVDVSISVTIQWGRSLTELTQAIRDTIRKELDGLLASYTIEEINVLVKKIVDGERPTKAVKTIEKDSASTTGGEVDATAETYNVNPETTEKDPT